tara:strand:- start:131 stop:1492 length:1362 start_codon:yes stop_codon:yes gene_type:complete
MSNNLVQKYNVPGPRYTSYPTVPYWEQEPLDENEWKTRVKGTFKATNTEEGIAVYIHLPFCSNMCHYCGCNVRFTQNHKVEEPYLKRVLQEWNMYLDLFEEKPNIAELHLGGGTPTFFSPENLETLLNGIFAGANLKPNAELSFEAHPGNTTKAHLETLYSLGFRRLSFGIQDFDPKVQEMINRIQPVEMVEEVVGHARAVGFESINFDLIYGLPLQTEDSVRDTLKEVRRMQPDRIAFYSYAHVPWIKGIQRKFTEDDLPKGEEKRRLYELGKELFEAAGYVEIGMDHFALKSDSLYKALQEGNLHRNFMGYTTTTTDLMVGLGVSSISDSWDAFAQNYKTIRQYEKALDEGKFPIFRGHLLNAEDKVIRRHILNLMCKMETEWHNESLQVEALYNGLEKLGEMEKDGLLIHTPYAMQVTEKGRPFVRNICMAIDARLNRNQPQTRIFSTTI